MTSTEQEVVEGTKARVLRRRGEEKGFQVLENSNFVPFDLAQKLKDGSLAYAGVEVMRLSAMNRPFIREKAEEKACELADLCGFDYVRVQAFEVPLEGYEKYILNFYVNRESE